VSLSHVILASVIVPTFATANMALGSANSMAKFKILIVSNVVTLKAAAKL
jgi:hypothetical protein